MQVGQDGSETNVCTLAYVSNYSELKLNADLSGICGPRRRIPARLKARQAPPGRKERKKKKEKTDPEIPNISKSLIRRSWYAQPWSYKYTVAPRRFKVECIQDAQIQIFHLYRDREEMLGQKISLTGYYGSDRKQVPVCFSRRVMF